MNSIERIALEFVEDLHHDSVAYCEVRIVPHMFLPNGEFNIASLKQRAANFQCEKSLELAKALQDQQSNTKPEDVIDAVLRGLNLGQHRYGTKVNVVLFSNPDVFDHIEDTLRLCKLYKNRGVVGFDFSRFEGWLSETDAIVPEGVRLINVCKAAKKEGIKMTHHAGEDGPGRYVEQAITLLGADRIGHGYRVLESEEVYLKWLKRNVHFEICPHSSYMTGAIKALQTPSKRHPMLRFVEDGASISISTDTPTLTGTHLEEEYELLRKWGLNETHFVRANFEAARHSFLPPNEKKELVELLKKNFGFLD